MSATPPVRAGVGGRGPAGPAAAHGTGAWSGTWFSCPQPGGSRLAGRGRGLAAVRAVLERPPPARSDYSRAAQAGACCSHLIDILGGPGGSAGRALVRRRAPLWRRRCQSLASAQAGAGRTRPAPGPAGEAPSCTPVPAGRGCCRSRDLRSALVAGTATCPALTDKLLRPLRPPQGAVTDAACRLSAASSVRLHGDLGTGRAFAARAAKPLPASIPRITRLGRRRPAGGPDLGRGRQHHADRPGASLLGWIPQATLVVLPDVGHIPHIEDPRSSPAALPRRGRPGPSRPFEPASAPAKPAHRKDHRP